MAHTAAHPAAGRFDSVHGDEDGIDLAPHMDQALEEVVETVMLFARYPQPSKTRQRAASFDLYDFVDKKYDRAELVELVVGFLTSYGSDLGNIQQREAAKLEKMVEQELAGGEIVRERAEELANEALKAA